MSVQILVGDCRAILPTLPADYYHTVSTSPPYWGLRDYGIEPVVWGGDAGCEHVWGDEQIITNSAPRDHSGPYAFANTRGQEIHRKMTTLNASQGQFCQKCGAWLGCLGLEPTPDLYVAHLVDIFRDVRRVLRDDGTLWLNLGDCYSAGGGKQVVQTKKASYGLEGMRQATPGLAPKQLVGIPWMVAFALRADGWWLRSAPPWIKNNAMPESVRDRPTTAHEYWFLLSKSQRYFWDTDAARMPLATGIDNQEDYQKRIGTKPNRQNGIAGQDGRRTLGLTHATWHPGRNRRTSDFWHESLDVLIEQHQIYLAHLLDIRDNGGLLLDEDGDPLGLMFPTKSFKDAHFATFSPDLIEPLLRASTSSHGCCPECGAPWERVTERVEAEETRPRPFGNGSGRKDEGRGYTETVSISLGFRPTCDHDAAPVPCRALDPFGGAGTTGLVADRLGLDATLIEIKGEYAEMARARIAEDAGPMLASVETLAEPEQLELFGG